MYWRNQHWCVTNLWFFSFSDSLFEFCTIVIIWKNSIRNYLLCIAIPGWWFFVSHMCCGRLKIVQQLVISFNWLKYDEWDLRKQFFRAVSINKTVWNIIKLNSQNGIQFFPFPSTLGTTNKAIYSASSAFLPFHWLTFITINDRIHPILSNSPHYKVSSSQEVSLNSDSPCQSFGGRAMGRLSLGNESWPLIHRQRWPAKLLSSVYEKAISEETTW